MHWSKLVIGGTALALAIGCAEEPEGTPLAGINSPPRPASSASTTATGGVGSGESNPPGPTPAPTMAPAPTPTPETFRVTTYGVDKPGALAVDAEGNFWIGSTDHSSATPASRLYKLSAAGTLLASPSVGIVPKALVTDGSSNLYVTDGKQLMKFDPAGAAVGSVAFNGADGGAGIALDASAGRLWLVGGRKVFTYSTALAPQNSYDFQATASARPTALALDASGNAWVVGGPAAAKIASGAPDDAFALAKRFDLWASDLKAVLVRGSTVYIAQPGIYVKTLDANGSETGGYLAGTGAEQLAADGSGNILAASATALHKLAPGDGRTMATHTVSAGLHSLLFAGGFSWFTSTGTNALIKATF